MSDRLAERRARRTWRLLDGFGQWVAFDSAGNAVAYGPEIPSRKFDMGGGKDEYAEKHLAGIRERTRALMAREGIPSGSEILGTGELGGKA